MTQVFRVTPADSGFAEEIPARYGDVNLAGWNRFLHDVGCVCVLNDYPNGDINVNMLPTIPGEAPVEYAVFRVKASQRSESVCLLEMDRGKMSF